MDNAQLIFSGRSHPDLASRIARSSGLRLGNIHIETFPDSEIGVQINENVRGRDAFVVQTIAKDPSLYLMELLIIVDALKRASARSIVAVIPYFGYARQDRKDKGRVPITAKLVADLLQTAGVTRVLTMDLHSEQIQGFFDLPVDNLPSYSLLAGRLKHRIENPVVVAPDVGSAKRARTFALELDCEIAMINKKRCNAREIEVGALIGDVKGQTAILVDDICSTGGTLRGAARLCKEMGAQNVVAAVTHALDCGFDKTCLDGFFVTDTIPGCEAEVISVDGLFAEAIDAIVHSRSISSLYRRF